MEETEKSNDHGEEGRMEYSYELKIPKERIAVIIGKNGETKKELEETTNSRLFVDSEEGEVRISGEDSIGLFVAKELIKAIGRGFNPEIAMQILNPENVFSLLELKDFASGKKGMLRLKGRVIGKEGKSRITIENLTETHISVYGKTIGVIGRAENVANARKAIETLLEGSPHATVYKWLEKKRSDMIRADIMGGSYLKKDKKNEPEDEEELSDEDGDDKDNNDEKDSDTNINN